MENVHGSEAPLLSPAIGRCRSVTGPQCLWRDRFRVQAGTGGNGTAAPQPRPGHVVATVPGASGSIAVQGVLSAIFSDVYMVRAEHVDPVPMPDIPFIFSIHQQEPYAY